MFSRKLAPPLVEVLISRFTDLEAVSRKVLEAAMHETGSKCGFIGIIDPISKALEIKASEAIHPSSVEGKNVTFYPDENGKYPRTLRPRVKRKESILHKQP